MLHSNEDNSKWIQHIQKILDNSGRHDKWARQQSEIFASRGANRCLSTKHRTKPCLVSIHQLSFALLTKRLKDQFYIHVSHK